MRNPVRYLHFCCTRKTRILCCRLCHCCNYCLLYHVPAHIDNRNHLSWYCQWLLYNCHDTLEILFALLAIIFSSASFVFLCASFIHTNSAFNGLTTLLGTLIGFFAAIYVPYGNMPQTLKYIIRFLPAFQGASAIREIWMNQELQWFHCPSEIKTGYADYMGLTISFGNATLSPHMKILYMFISGLIFLGLATAILSRKRQQER